MKVAVLIMLSFLCSSCWVHKNKVIVPNDVDSIGLISYEEKSKDTVFNRDRDRDRDTVFIKDKNEIGKFAEELKGIQTYEVLVFVPQYRAIIFYKNHQDVYLLSGKYHKSNEGIFKVSNNLDFSCDNLIQRYKK